MQTPALPPPFIRQMQAILGPEWPAFEDIFKHPAPVSIRLNRVKMPAPAIALEAAPVPWHPDGFYLSERPVFTLDPVFHAGGYYVQEASSMFVYEALRQALDFSKPLKILDLCAAPGGKSTLLAALPQPETGHHVVVSNETIRSRTASLRENLERWGSPFVAVTNAEAEEMALLEGWFDVVLTDAPCSGEGLFRKDPDAIQEWSAPHVEFCAARQKRILAAAVQALAPGGILLFSTCTYNTQENDENGRWLTQEFDLQAISLKIPLDWNIEERPGGYQFYPHRVRGEGFFLAAFRKNEGPALRQPAVPNGFKSLKPLSKALATQVKPWILAGAEMSFFQLPNGEVLGMPASMEEAGLILDKHLRNKWLGTFLGEFKGKDFVPGHALALSQWAAPELPAIELDRMQALLFLKKEAFEPPAGSPQGWALARFEGLNLGWVKLLPNRLNNYLPQERRIRMAIS